MMIDTYREGFNFITNYVYVDTLSVLSLSDHIKKGHLFTAFRNLGDAAGVMFNCTDQNNNLCGIMGDLVALEKIKTFNAVSSLPGQFRFLHKGKIVNKSSYDTYEYNWGEMIEKEANRIYLQIKIRNKDLQWIYSNPIYVF